MKRIAAVLLLILVSLSLQAEVTRIEITERVPLADGHEFGDTGAYEKIRGILHYEMDPANPANSMIVDLQFAPRNERGMVECRGDFILLSLEERYGSKDIYVTQVISVTRKLLKERLLLQHDADSILQAAEDISWPPVMLDRWPFWK